MRVRNLVAIALFALMALTGLADRAHAAEGEPELIHLYQYKPIYFLMGNPYTKIELSFKVQVVRTVPVFFGYTQLMFWDLFISDPFFHDINYAPEAFYRWSFGDSLNATWLDVGAFKHESNGRGGAEERSWNRSYLRLHTVTGLGGKARLLWDFEAWAVWFTNSNNSDLARYRGSWEATLTLTDFLGSFFELGDLALRVYPGGASTINPGLGGQELTFRGKMASRNFMPLFVAQVFHGYGESMLDYNQERWGFRAGIGF